MKTTFAFISLLFLASIAFSFPASDYLYPGESEASVSSDSFTLDSSTSSFTLVKISSNPVFLLKDDAPVTDITLIAQYLREYYQTRLYPSEEELGELRQFFVDFNASRDAEVAIFLGSDVKFKAESTCRQQTGLSTIMMCSTQSECNALAGIICALYEGSSCDPGVLGAGIYPYAVAVSSLDTQMAAVFSALDTMTQDNMNDKLTILSGTIAPLRTAANSLAHSTLRMPTTEGDICMPGTCYAGQSCWTECSQLISICPSEILPTSKLDLAAAKISSLQGRVASLSQPEAVSMQVAAATQERLAYRDNALLAAEYTSKYNALKARHAPVVETAENTSSLVMNAQLDAKLSVLHSAAESIETSIASKDFSRLNFSFAQYENASGELAPIVANENLTASYWKAIDAQDDASDALLSAGWAVNSNNQQELEGYNRLVFRMRALDGTFQPPLSDAQYSQLSQNYTGLTSDINAFIASTRSPQELFVGVGTTVSATSVNGAMSILNTIVPINFQMRQQLSPFILPAVILLTDASILSLILVAFVFSLIYLRGFFANKLVLAAWIGVTIMFVGFVLVGSLGMFYAMQGSSGISSFSDFYAQVQSSPMGVIILDKTATADVDELAMASCAAQIKSQLESLDKTAIEYTINGDVCTIGDNASTLSTSNCLANVPDYPIFYLKYASENSVRFSVVEQKQATIAGNREYFNRCDIGNVLN